MEIHLYHKESICHKISKSIEKLLQRFDNMPRVVFYFQFTIHQLPLILNLWCLHLGKLCPDHHVISKEDLNSTKTCLMSHLL